MNACRYGLVAVCLVSLLIQRASGGESRNASKAQAKEVTAKALAAEIEGNLEARARLLEEAAKADPLSPAHAQQGKLRSRNGWLGIDEAAEKIAALKAMQRYEAMRDELPNTAPAHWQMAETCLAAKLPDQARAHMNRVLELDPNFEPARAALGYRKVGGVWVSPEQLAADEAQAAAEAVSLAKHGKLMRDLLSGLSSKDKRQQSKAEQRLLEIRDPSTILAAEKIVSPTNAAAAQVVVNYLAKIQDPIATLSLARHAVFYPSPDVRREAALKLGERDLHDYAPSLLSLLSAPIQSASQPIFARNGQLMGVRQVFTREGQDQNQVVVMDSQLVRQRENVFIAPPSGRVSGLERMVNAAALRRASQESEALAQATVASDNLQRQRMATAQNEQLRDRNARVMSAMTIATGVELPEYPEVWWKWYDDQIWVKKDGPKYSSLTQSLNQYAISNFNPAYLLSGPSQSEDRPPGPIGGECFVAGTKVATHRGAVSIEKIKLGDMVLSKNIASGALEFKPVLQTTVRPIEELASLRAGGNSFECTRGHFFWVSGRGWVKAEELKPGMVLHAAEQPIKVDEVCMGGEEETYNLRVADNANYFVGEGRVLSHDVTARAPTREVIPGYIAPAGSAR